MSLYNTNIESEIDGSYHDEVAITDEVDTVEKPIDGWHIFGTECPKEEIVFLCHRCQHLQLDCTARRPNPLDGFVEQLVGLSTTQSIA